MTTALPASFQTWMVSAGYTTEAEASARGTGVITDQTALDQMVLYGVLYATYKSDDIEAVKAEILDSTSEIEKNNLSTENWNLRKKIIESNWPSDTTLQAELWQLIQEDTNNPPPALPKDPPYFQEGTLDEIQSSYDRAEKILAILDDAQAVEDDGGEATIEWPTQVGLLIQLRKWLSANGVDESDLKADMIATPGEDTAVADIPTTWDVPDEDHPLVRATPNSDTYYIKTSDAYHKAHKIEKGSDDTYQVGDAQWVGGIWDGNVLIYKDNLTRNGVNVSMWPDGGDDAIRYGDIWIDEETKDLYFVPTGNGFEYTPPSLVPDDLGLQCGTDSDGPMYLWNDGDVIYRIDRSLLESDSVVATHLTEIFDAYSTDEPWTPFVDFAITEYTPSYSYIKDPTDDQRTAWSDFASDVLLEIDSNSTNWSGMARSQEIQMQELVADYGIWVNWGSDVQERLERLMSSLVSDL